jgi:hypothetical protein
MRIARLGRAAALASAEPRTGGIAARRTGLSELALMHEDGSGMPLPFIPSRLGFVHANLHEPRRNLV